MRYIADLHIHSPFSRATSKLSNLEGLAAWSAVKGINVIGTGDFTHPGWFQQLQANLQPAEPGFFKLRQTNIPQIFATFPASRANSCRFVLTAEISTIYKRHNRVRKIHTILFVPDFASAAKINARLAGIGNIESDGRPILGLDARDLLEIVLELAPDGFLVPAHIWTPWFSLFGSKSGFDSIDECFADLSRHVFALETGLSSDPAMNRLVSALDRFTLISNSDCHSPGKLGREANLFTCGFNYFSMRDALEKPALGGFQGTIEFFPEEGKYHHDGHRKCGISLTPTETRKIDGVCPVCGKPLTIGVMHRVMELADREEPFFQPNAPGSYSLIPLVEVLGEIFSRGPATKTVLQEYAKLVTLFESEFNLLLNVAVDEIGERYSPVLGEAIDRIRRGRVIRRAGFDGEFGVISVFDAGELKRLTGQYSLFSTTRVRKKTESGPGPSLLEFTPAAKARPNQNATKSLNREQAAAVSAMGRHVVVTAGPGTGKTHTLVARLAKLLQDVSVEAKTVTAITFTNRAADEMRERLQAIPGINTDSCFIGTFHAFCLKLLRQLDSSLTVVSEEQQARNIKKMFPSELPGRLYEIRQGITSSYHHPEPSPGSGDDSSKTDPCVHAYLQELRLKHGIDLDGVIPRTVSLLMADSEFLEQTRSGTRHLFIDEFQDLNENQYELVRLLGQSCAVFAIGDPDQAIYGFRGSSPQFFHRFISEFGAETVSLSRNYRSASNILMAAGAVIANNHPLETGYSAKIIAEHSESGAIELYRAVSARAEAEFVVQRIEELMGGISHFSIDSGRGGKESSDVGRSFKDFAVLYRMSQQAETLREALERRGIPFQVVNVTPFFMHRDIKPLYYWIQAAAGLPTEGVAARIYLGILGAFPGIGSHTLSVLENRLPLGACPDFFNRAAEVKLPQAVLAKIRDVEEQLESFREAAATKGIAQPAGTVMDYLRLNRHSDAASRFLKLAGSFGTDLQGFATHLRKNETATVYDEKAEAVSLITLHGAKGLEFPVVFITGMEEGLFPGDLKKTSPGNDRATHSDALAIEEERRLFYVGMTRARNVLVLTSAGTRKIFGSYRSRAISPFIAEIPASLYRQLEQAASRKRKKEVKQMKLFP